MFSGTAKPTMELSGIHKARCEIGREFSTTLQSNNQSNSGFQSDFGNYQHQQSQPIRESKNLMMDIIGENMGKNKSKEVKIQEVITSAHSQVVQQRRKLKGHWMGR